MQQSSLSLKYRPDIDGLRAIAIISVVIYHAFPSNLRGGFSGVDVFFVISGYLISSIIYKNCVNGTFSFADFYYRRVKRILPPLLLVLSSLMAVCWFTMLAPDFKLLGKHVSMSSLFIQNIYLYSEINYFDEKSDLKPLLHLWSLAVEEQFYLLLPPILVLLISRKRYLFTITAALILVSFLWNVLEITASPSYTFYGFQFRVWELMTGGFLAFLELNNIKLIRYQNISSGLGLLLLALGFVIIPQNQFPGWWALIPAIGTTLLIASQNSLINRNFLSSKPLVAVGLISFSLYLWHWPLLSLLKLFSSELCYETSYFYFLKSIVIGISITLAAITYIFVEKPLRKKQPSTVFTVLMCMLLAVVALAGYAIDFQNGFEGRAAEVEAEIRKFHRELNAEFQPKNCSEIIRIAGTENCRYFGDIDTVDVVVIGDSHSLTYAGALHKHFPNRSIHIFETGDNPGLIGAGWLDSGIYAINGRRNFDPAFSWADQHNAKVIVLIFRGPPYVEEKNFGSEEAKTIVDDANPDGGNKAIIFENALRKTFAKFYNKAELVFVFDNPEFGFNPERSCLRPRFPLAWQANSRCSIDKSVYEARQKRYRTIVRRVLSEFPKVKTFDPEPFICNANECNPFVDGVLIYHDSNHLTPYGVFQLSDHFEF